MTARRTSRNLLDIAILTFGMIDVVILTLGFLAWQLGASWPFSLRDSVGMILGIAVASWTAKERA
jgi:hypothetical protein